MRYRKETIDYVCVEKLERKTYLKVNHFPLLLLQLLADGVFDIFSIFLSLSLEGSLLLLALVFSGVESVGGLGHQRPNGRQTWLQS